jgi:hypothetical protein
MRLITTDTYMPYIDAIFAEYSEIINPISNGKYGRPRQPFRVLKPRLTYERVKNILREGGSIKLILKSSLGL